MIDLERREVIDVLSDRSAEATAGWLSQHTKVEIVSRDRCGLYAEGARRERLRRGRSPTVFICSRTSAKLLNSS